MVKFETIGIAVSGGLMIVTALITAIGSISESGPQASPTYEQAAPAPVNQGSLKPEYALLLQAHNDDLG